MQFILNQIMLLIQRVNYSNKVKLLMNKLIGKRKSYFDCVYIFYKQLKL